MYSHSKKFFEGSDMVEKFVVVIIIAKYKRWSK